MTETAVQGVYVDSSQPAQVALRLYDRWVVRRQRFVWSLTCALGWSMLFPLILALASAAAAPLVAFFMDSVVGSVDRGESMFALALGLCAAVGAQRLTAWLSVIILRRRCELVSSAVQRCLVRRSMITPRLDSMFSVNLMVLRYPDILAQYVFTTSFIGNGLAVVALIAVTVATVGIWTAVAALAGIILALASSAALNAWEARASFTLEQREATRSRLLTAIWNDAASLRRQSMTTQALAAFDSVRAPQVQALKRRVRAKSVSQAVLDNFVLIAFVAGMLGLWVIGREPGLGSGIVLLVLVRLLGSELTEAIGVFSCFQDARPVLRALTRQWLATPTVVPPVTGGAEVTLSAEARLPVGACGIVLGLSGSGKTHLLRELAGVGGSISDEPGARVCASSSILLERDRPLVPGTVRESVTLWQQPVDERRYADALESSGLAHDIVAWGPVGDQRRVGGDDGLSDGERVRVHLAQARYWRTETLLLDDVFAAFDPATAHAVAATTLDTGTVVFSSSRVELAEHADHVITVEHGRTVVHPAQQVSAADLADYADPRTCARVVHALRAGAARSERQSPTHTPILPVSRGVSGPDAAASADLQISLPALRDLFRNTASLFGRGGAVAVMGLAILTTACTVASAQVADAADAADGFSSLGGLAALTVAAMAMTLAVYQVGGSRAVSRMTRLQRQVIGRMLGSNSDLPLSRITIDVHQIEFRSPEQLAAVFTGLMASAVVLVAAVVTAPVLLVGLLPALGMIAVIYIKGRLWRKRALMWAVAAREPLVAFAGAASTIGATFRQPDALQALYQRLVVLSDEAYVAGRRSLNVRAVILGLVELIALALFSVITLTLATRSTSDAGLAAGATIYLAYSLTTHVASTVESLQQTDGLQSLFSRVGSLTGHPILTVPDHGLETTDRPFDIRLARDVNDELLVAVTPPLTVPAGRVVALNGRSGVGKSTLIRRVVNTPEPAAANTSSVLLLDADIPPLGHTVAGFLNPHATFTTNEVDRAWSVVHDAVGRVPVAPQRPLDDLAHGERQLANLARALLHAPDLLLLDEALSAMDSATEARVLTAIPTLFPQTATLVVLHRQNNIGRAHRIVTLSHNTATRTEQSDMQIEPAMNPA